MTALEKKCWRFGPPKKKKKKRNGARTLKKNSNANTLHIHFIQTGKWYVKVSFFFFFVISYTKCCRNANPGSETHGANMLNVLVGEVRFVSFGSALVEVTWTSISTCLNEPTAVFFLFFYHHCVHGWWGSNMHSNKVCGAAYVHSAGVIAEL